LIDRLENANHRRATLPPAIGTIASMMIRPAAERDHDAIWQILEPMILAGDTYPLPIDMSRADALRYWFAPDHEVFVAETQDEIVGTYYLRANQRGGGAHVSNCGYVTAPAARGRGIARAMCEHSLARAKARGFRAMQFNFVVSTNERAVRLWRDVGFAVVGRLPDAFHHPLRGDVDALVMFRRL
jgi:ribosomal protein S18 acetylase RimI-like enzyme